MSGYDFIKGGGPGTFATRPFAAVLVIGAFAIALTLGVSSSAAKLTLGLNPANDPVLIDRKLDPVRYDGADGCRKQPTKGIRRLIKWMERTTRPAFNNAIRCDGGVHGTGRALDWTLDARKKGEKREAMRVINTWMAKDDQGRRNAFAQRMGIQLIIFNCKFWQAGDTKMSRYSACSGGRENADPTQGHIDHIHIELTKPAAKLKTSFWRSDLAGDDGDGGTGTGNGGNGGGGGNGGNGGGGGGGVEGGEGGGVIAN